MRARLALLPGDRRRAVLSQALRLPAGWSSDRQALVTAAASFATVRVDLGTAGGA